MAEIIRFATLDSTMLKAAELADAGAPHGTVILADEQTQGVGRLGRAWHSEPGTGLYMTAIYRPKLCADSLPVVTLALGVAAADAIEQTTGFRPDLRWPNDLLFDGQKCGGILTQLHSGVLLAGIGINVNQTAFPEDLGGIATSLRSHSGREHSREALLNGLIGSIEPWLERLFAEGKSPIFDAFTASSSYVRGRRVVVEQPEGAVRGVTDGLDPQGFLRLRTDDGARILIIAGGVRPEDIHATRT